MQVIILGKISRNTSIFDERVAKDPRKLTLHRKNIPPMKLGTTVNRRRQDCPNGLEVRAKQGNVLVLACVFALQNRTTRYSILRKWFREPAGKSFAKDNIFCSRRMAISFRKNIDQISYIHTSIYSVTMTERLVFLKSLAPAGQSATAASSLHPLYVLCASTRCLSGGTDRALLFQHCKRVAQKLSHLQNAWIICMHWYLGVESAHMCVQMEDLVAFHANSNNTIFEDEVMPTSLCSVWITHSKHNMLLLSNHLGLVCQRTWIVAIRRFTE